MSKRRKIIVLSAIFVVAALIIIYNSRLKSFREDEFIRLMQVGKNYLDQGEYSRALELYKKAYEIKSNSPDVNINLAICYLFLKQPTNAIYYSDQAIKYDDKIAAPYYIKGCAFLRLGEPEKAIKMFQLSINLNQNVAASYFHLGRAHLEAGQIDDAIAQLQAAIDLQPEHPAAHYLLGQAYQRANDKQSAEKELQIHQKIREKLTNEVVNLEFLEKSILTAARIPFEMEKPSEKPIQITFTDATSEVFTNAPDIKSPVAVIDYNHDGRNSLFAMDRSGFRVFSNSNGVFYPLPQIIPAIQNAGYLKSIVGDIQNDGVEDVVVLGENASQVFKFSTNAQVVDATALSGLKGLKATDGLLADLDYTGALDLVVVEPKNKSIKIYQNLKNFYFKDNTTNSGLSESITGVEKIIVEDFNDDELPDLILSKPSSLALFYEKRRGGKFFETNFPPQFPKGKLLATGDFNNDLKTDAVILDDAGDTIVFFSSINKIANLPTKGLKPENLYAYDYDNDGWLDIFVIGNGIRLFRNIGNEKFKDVTSSTGLNKYDKLQFKSAYFADFDNDGDTDIILSQLNNQLKYLRNNGGNKNNQLKLRLIGTRSNTSAIGVKIEVSAGGLKLTRAVHQLPIEIGVGNHKTIDAVTIGWFDLTLSTVDIQVEQKQIEMLEIYFPKGSCPYMYVWDGEKFRFVSDFLGNSPLGLRISEDRFVDADTDEHLWLGTTSNVKPKNGFYTVQLTEELSEALYLDKAELVVVDHPAATVVQTTSKMRPSPPYPPSEIVLLHKPMPLIKATRSDGLDVTETLQKRDDIMVSPVKLRVPQLRGLCEPYSITMDFGNLPERKPLVLVMTGWIKFGGGMANVAASHCPDLPFPFPVLEAQTEDGHWHKLDLTVGVPSGKTKTIIVELSGKLPQNARLLRLTMAYELYWDFVCLYEKTDLSQAKIISIPPKSANLHWRGYSNFKNLPSHLPLTPDYYDIANEAPWKIVPAGWCTKYGEVVELVETQDNALAIINGGDELTLYFPENALPEIPEGYERDFFIYSVGWDKDTDFHIECGTTVEPLPWHNMDYQNYGKQKRPSFESDSLMKKYTTRYVGAPVPIKKLKYARK
jgi:tetratricopeptide (TPR) repeat protein